MKLKVIKLEKSPTLRSGEKGKRRKSSKYFLFLQGAPALRSAILQQQQVLQLQTTVAFYSTKDAYIL